MEQISGHESNSHREVKLVASETSLNKLQFKGIKFLGAIRTLVVIMQLKK